MVVVRMRKLRRYIYHELKQRDAYLVPLRLFMGIGWCRAAVEKTMVKGWLTGEGVQEFLGNQLMAAKIVFPFYALLTENIFLPHAALFAWLVFLGQIVAGVCIFLGFLCNFGLIVGMFMNLNFVLAGEVNPSAFYLVIQTILFCGNAGAIFGLDSRISKTIPIALVVSQPDFHANALWIEKFSFLLLPIFSLGIAMYASMFVEDFSPHGVHDPALILMVLAAFGGLATLITFFRITHAQDKKNSR